MPVSSRPAYRSRLPRCIHYRHRLADRQRCYCCIFPETAKTSKRIIGIHLHKRERPAAPKSAIRLHREDIFGTAAISMRVNNGIRGEYGTEILHIISRGGTEIRPVGMLCPSCESATERFPLIRHFLEKEKSNN